ncbi:hypothetical protein Hanom_Chr03g00190011 [Helianthus anomalus]
MEMGGSSNAVGVSKLSPELKFMLASNINISNFVTVTLSGRSNYRLWEAQMGRLIDSQQLRGLIDDDYGLPDNMRGSYEQLLIGWILSSVNEKILKDLLERFHADILKASNIWMELQSSYMPPFSERHIEGTYSNNYHFLMSHCLNETVSILLLKIFSF